MGIAQRVSSLLNYEIKIDLNRRIDKKTAYIVIGVVTVLILTVGYLAGQNWFWNPKRNLFEYQIEQINKNPDGPETQVELALVTYLNGDAAKAEGVLRGILSKQPQNTTASLYLGLILSDQKKYREAIGLLTASTKQSQGIAARMVYLYLGKDYLAVGQSATAAKYLEQAAVTDPGNPVVYYTLGQAYEKMNNTRKAIGFYEKALKLSPDYSEPEIALKNLLTKQSTTQKAAGHNKSK